MTSNGLPENQARRDGARLVCPTCNASIPASDVARFLGSRGGSATGSSKRRDVDYVALSAKAAQARRAKKIGGQDSAPPKEAPDGERRLSEGQEERGDP